MLSRECIIALLERMPDVTAIDATSDRSNSVPNTVVRCVRQGRRTVAVGTDSKTQIGGLLDLVDLHLHGADVLDGTPVAPDEVTFLLATDDWDTEAEGAVRTLAAQLDAGFQVDLCRLTSRGEVLPISAAGLDDLGDHRKYRYTDWLGLLTGVEGQPPPLVQRLMAAVPDEELRAYPVLGSKDCWALRLEGLEVAQVGPDRGWADVGADYDGRRGPERTTWLGTAPEGRLVIADGDGSVDDAAAAINRFADAWAEVLKGSGKHNEYALESRVLRGSVPVRTSSGELGLLRGVDGARVNWGASSRPAGAGPPPGARGTSTHSSGTCRPPGRWSSRSRVLRAWATTTGTPSPRQSCTGTSSGRPPTSRRGSSVSAWFTRRAEPLSSSRPSDPSTRSGGPGSCRCAGSSTSSSSRCPSGTPARAQSSRRREAA